MQKLMILSFSAGEFCFYILKLPISNIQYSISNEFFHQRTDSPSADNVAIFKQMRSISFGH
jgi:hypothetical protein